MQNLLVNRLVPAALLKFDETALKETLSVGGVTVSSITEVTSLKGFGDRVFQQSAPVLPVGTRFMLGQAVVVDGTSRTGEAFTYDAFVCLLDNGAKRTIPVTQILESWPTCSKDTDPVLSPKQIEAYEPHGSLKIIDDFVDKHDTKDVVNSKFANGFKPTLSIMEKWDILAAGVLTVLDNQTYQYDYIDKVTSDKRTGRRRLVAFTRKTTKAELDKFQKDVNAAKK